MYNWKNQDWARFDEAINRLDFGRLDKETIIANSLANVSDVSEADDPVHVAIDTAKMYINSGVESY